jgi:hypothetical protein
MEKESSRDRKRESAKKHNSYSCYSAKSIRILEQNKTKGQSSGKK